MLHLCICVDGDMTLTLNHEATAIMQLSLGGVSYTNGQINNLPFVSKRPIADKHVSPPLLPSTLWKKIEEEKNYWTSDRGWSLKVTLTSRRGTCVYERCLQDRVHRFAPGRRSDPGPPVTLWMIAGTETCLIPGLMLGFWWPPHFDATRSNPNTLPPHPPTPRHASTLLTK